MGKVYGRNGKEYHCFLVYSMIKFYCVRIDKEGESCMKYWANIYKNILMLTQFGFSFITPLLLCLVICWWISSKLGVGNWIYILGFFFGIGGSGMVAYKFYLKIGEQQKRNKADKIYFNEH